MLFNSFTYLIFLGIVVATYWKAPRNFRLWMLFSAGIVFYSFWRWEYMFVMLGTLTVDFFVAQKIENAKAQRTKKNLLLLSLVCNLGLLLYFKYTIFFLNSINGLLLNFGQDSFSLPWQIILPIGISFYTFQSLGYVVDVYRGYKKPVKEYALYGTFVTFFPQLIAGPILRAKEVIPQFDKKPIFNSAKFALGLRMILSGLFLKVVLADNIAPFVDTAFSVPAVTMSALDVWVVSFLFGFQIYFDFSAYSLIAIGSAKLMGIDFPANFNFPYIAKSPKDFWKRWHISLSSWIRDYLYLPLAGVKPKDESIGGLSDTAETNQKSKMRFMVALILTWIIMGLWHGASWTFAAWGLWHATLIILYRLLSKLNIPPFKAVSFIGWCFTLPLIMLSWIFFRAQSIDSALTMISHTLNPLSYLNFDRWGTSYMWELLPINIDPLNYAITTILLLSFIACWAFKSFVWNKIHNASVKNIFLMFYIALLSFFTFVFLQTTGQFIYFQF